MTENHETASVGETVVQVADDAKAYASAQVALYKSMALVRWRVAQGGLIFGTIAVLLAFAALVTLPVGLVLALSPQVGPLGATGIVVGVTLVIAAILGWVAGQKLGVAFGPIK